jgi:hypothetical protein
VVTATAPAAGPAAPGERAAASPGPVPGAARPSHRRRAADGTGAPDRQAIWLVFGGTADQPWLRPLRRGFRHCFAAIEDGAGWTVLDPLSGHLVVARLDLPPRYDLPGFYRRAGLAVLGPFAPGGPQRRLLPPLMPFTCVALCRPPSAPARPSR